MIDVVVDKSEVLTGTSQLLDQTPRRRRSLILSSAWKACCSGVRCGPSSRPW
jgi:hypothetical protein